MLGMTPRYLAHAPGWEEVPFTKTRNFRGKDLRTNQDLKIEISRMQL